MWVWLRAEAGPVRNTCCSRGGVLEVVGWVLSCSAFRSRGPGQEGLNSLGEGLVSQSCSPLLLLWQSSSAVSGFPLCQSCFPPMYVSSSVYQTVATDRGEIWWQTLVISVLHYHASPRICTFCWEVGTATGQGTSSSSVTFVWESWDTSIFFIQRNHLPYSPLLPTFFCYLSPGDHSTTRTLVTKHLQWTPRSACTAWKSCLGSRLLHTTSIWSFACLKLSSISSSHSIHVLLHAFTNSLIHSFTHPDSHWASGTVFHQVPEMNHEQDIYASCFHEASSPVKYICK